MNMEQMEEQVRKTPKKGRKTYASELANESVSIDVNAFVVAFGILCSMSKKERNKINAKEFLFDAIEQNKVNFSSNAYT